MNSTARERRDLLRKMVRAARAHGDSSETTMVDHAAWLWSDTYSQTMARAMFTEKPKRTDATIEDVRDVVALEADEAVISFLERFKVDDE